MNDSNKPDRDAQLVALLTEHQSALRFFVASLLPGESAAQDVAQLANTKIWDKRDDFELGTNFKAWIFSIARYEVLNFRKRQARDSRLVFSDELEEVFAEELPEVAEDLEERQVALRSCLAQLRDTDRELIEQRYFEKSDLADYATKVGRTAGSLRVSLHRIRNSLHGCIQSKLNAQPEGGV